MNKIVVAVFALAASSALADIPTKAYEIWPEGKIPLAQENPKPESVEPMRDDIVRISNVSVPQIVVVLAIGAEKPVPVIIVCPGGGYSILAWNHEGVEVAQWLRGQGIASVILKYRVPGQRDAALADAQRTIRWIRANAARFNIDPTKVGMMGFSAGANLTVRTATNSKKPIYAPIDEIDKQSCRPDFQMPIYPWDLVTRKDKNDVRKGHEGMQIRLDEYPVDADTPRAFIVQSEDDFCKIETSLGYYAALKNAGVGAELHAFEKGGHGYGIRRLGSPTDDWPVLAQKWLEQFK